MKYLFCLILFLAGAFTGYFLSTNNQSFSTSSGKYNIDTIFKEVRIPVKGKGKISYVKMFDTLRLKDTITKIISKVDSLENLTAEINYNEFDNTFDNKYHLLTKEIIKTPVEKHWELGGGVLLNYSDDQLQYSPFISAGYKKEIGNFKIGVESIIRKNPEIRLRIGMEL